MVRGSFHVLCPVCRLTPWPVRDSVLQKMVHLMHVDVMGPTVWLEGDFPGVAGIRLGQLARAGQSRQLGYDDSTNPHPLTPPDVNGSKAKKK